MDDYEQAGGGIITDALTDEAYDRRNIRLAPGAVTELERREMTGHRGFVVWLTGLSGAGKSTLATAVERRLLFEGIPAFTLDGDLLRTGLCADLGFTDADRTENQRRCAQAAALLKKAGQVVLVSTISPLQKHRDFARSCIGEDFMEVYIKADLETCRRRDPKQLYQKQADGGISNFTGVDSAYEVPAAPDLVLDTAADSEAYCIEALLDAVRSKLA